MCAILFSQYDEDAKIANNIVERLTKRIMKKLLQVVPLSEQNEPHSRD